MTSSFHSEEARHNSGHARSYYAATARGLSPRPALCGPVKCGVCVIGGGITGTMAALTLAEKGTDVVLLEANRIGWGASGRNGGQLWRGQRLGQRTLERLAGEDTARALWDLAEEAVQLVHTRIARHGISCDYQTGALLAAASRADFEDMRADAEYMAQAYGETRLKVIEPGGMGGYVASRRYHGGLWDPGSGHLHTLDYVTGLARAAEEAGATIFENTQVSHWTDGPPYRIDTASGPVTAEALILAANAYGPDLSPALAPYVLPITSFVGVTAPLTPEQAHALIPSGGCVADTSMVLDYYRITGGNRLLFGGGEAYSHRFPKDVAPIIARRMAHVFPQLGTPQIEHAWAGWVAITRHRFPHFARLGPQAYAAQGFSGQGLAIAGLAGQLMVEAVMGSPERFNVFRKIRPLPFPGGRHFRHPLLVLGMLWAKLRDRLR